MSQPAAQISTLLTARIAAGDFPSAVYLVGERGRVRFAAAHGAAVRVPIHHAATSNTIYDLASLTKPLVTGLLCAQLLERGTLELDRPVAHYLAEFARPDKAALTVRQLLTHTSGLPAWRPLYLDTQHRPERTLAVLAAYPLAYAPGTRVVYSDLGFITLGLLLARLTATPLTELAQRCIFAPLGLRATFFNPAAAAQTIIAASESAGNAYERELCAHEPAAAADTHWRTQPVWGAVHDGNAHFLGGAAGHAGLFADAADTFMLAQQFLAEHTQTLRAETCTLFHTNLTPGLNEARALAWQLAATPDATAGAALPPDAFGHLGFTGTSLWLDPHRARVFILLTNRTHDHTLPFVNINSTRRQFHTLAVAALAAQ